jgi:hypothetical protein
VTPGLRKVEACTIRPFQCAMLPTLGARHAKGYYDTGQDDPEGWNHAYVSVEFVELAARAEGFASPAEVARLGQIIAEHERKIEALEAEIREADKFAESAEYTLAHLGERIRKKPGRPRKEAANADS